MTGPRRNTNSSNGRSYIKKVIRATMIGVHSDDCNFRYGGLALKYVRAGHQVKFLSLCNGCGEHPELLPDAIAKQRRLETLEVARLDGVEYDVWEDVPDCKLIERYSEQGRSIHFAETFQLCAYGMPLTSETEKSLFPF